MGTAVPCHERAALIGGIELSGCLRHSEPVVASALDFVPLPGRFWVMGECCFVSFAGFCCGTWVASQRGRHASGLQLGCGGETLSGIGGVDLLGSFTVEMRQKRECCCEREDG